jgi:para-aminobenzoate synthetase / 4-amino-4-deoxychorismate lyase
MPPEIISEDCVILHNAATAQWLYFKAPRQIITASRLDEVIPALERIEALVNQNRWYAAGFISYEAARAFDAAFVTHSSNDFPLLWFGLYQAPEQFILPDPDYGAYSLGEVIPSVSQSEYDHAIQRIKKFIRTGDTYQVNYTLRLRSAFSGEAWHLFLAMVRAQPSGYSAWIDTGRLVICSASPELFFCLDGDRLTCKPMKGTVKRGRTPDEDESFARWLNASEKNRAENLMIVDMIRNDLGRVGEIGSVHVPRLFEVERHPTLWQMTSTVGARSRKSLAEILAALFPCASITGAPKIRTTQIIAEVEPEPRRLYTGSIGYIAPNRFAQFNVAIRTAVVDRFTGQVEYGAGGGIVADSVCDDEYVEALLKARVLTERQCEFSLLETMLWTSDDSYFLLDYHLRRLNDSAKYFDYPIAIENIRRQLNARVAHYGGKPQRVRLLVGRDGSIEIQAAPLLSTVPLRLVRVKIAAMPISSNELFLYHKTTHRQVYDAARQSASDCDDVLLWNERGELTESCIANIVVEMDGELLTPPVDSGLLPGVFRALLLEQGTIRERTIKVSDLGKCSKLYLINSVRKWQEAVLLM